MSEESPWTPTRQFSPNCLIQSKSSRIATPFLDMMLLEHMIAASLVTTPTKSDERLAVGKVTRKIISRMNDIP